MGKSDGIAQELRQQITIIFGCVAIAWLVEVINLLLFQGQLRVFGIFPRQPIGLRGILFAPFLHGGWGHLIGNTVPFITMAWLVMLRETSDFFIVSVIAGLSSGLGTWLIGAPNSLHIGASGVVFGYLGYLLLRGYFERSVLAIALSLIVTFFYGGLLWGVLPIRYGMSWEGHLFGFLGGVLAARIMADRPGQRRRRTRV